MKHTLRRTVLFRVGFGAREIPVYDGDTIVRYRPSGGLKDRLTDTALEGLRELSRTRKGRRRLKALAHQRKEGKR